MTRTLTKTPRRPIGIRGYLTRWPAWDQLLRGGHVTAGDTARRRERQVYLLSKRSATSGSRSERNRAGDPAAARSRNQLLNNPQYRRLCLVATRIPAVV